MPRMDKRPRMDETVIKAKKIKWPRINKMATATMAKMTRVAKWASG